MYKRIIYSLLIFLFIAGMASADIKIYLRSQITSDKSDLVLNDIASIDSNNSDIEAVKNLKIHNDLLADGFIDRKELSDLLQNHSMKDVIIYGNAVRILNTGNVSESEPDLNQSFQKGDIVDVVVNNKGISLTIKGTVTSEGRDNDNIIVKPDIKTRYPKFLKGKIKGKGLIEVNL